MHMCNHNIGSPLPREDACSQLIYIYIFPNWRTFSKTRDRGTDGEREEGLSTVRRQNEKRGRSRHSAQHSSVDPTKKKYIRPGLCIQMGRDVFLDMALQMDRLSSYKSHPWENFCTGQAPLPYYCLTAGVPSTICPLFRLNPPRPLPLLPFRSYPAVLCNYTIGLMSLFFV